MAFAAQLEELIWSDVCNGISGVFMDVLLAVRKNGAYSAYVMRDHAENRSREHRLVFERLSSIMKHVEFPDGIVSLAKHNEILHLRYHEAVVACNCVIDGSCTV